MTGLDEDRHDILEFGAVVDDLQNPLPIEKLPRFHCYFLKEIYRGDPEVLVMHVEIFRRIASKSNAYKYCYPMKFGHAFKSFLVHDCGFLAERDRVTINVAGKNFGLNDLAFLRKQTDLLKHVTIRSRLIDPGILYARIDDDSVPGLEQCKKRAGIDGEVSHNAIDDAYDIVKLVRRYFKVKEVQQ
jgi:hypothetical protein